MPLAAGAHPVIAVVMGLVAHALFFLVASLIVVTRVLVLWAGMERQRLALHPPFVALSVRCLQQLLQPSSVRVMLSSHMALPPLPCWKRT